MVNKSKEAKKQLFLKDTVKTKFITKITVYSRLIIIGLQFFANFFIPDYNPGDAFIGPVDLTEPITNVDWMVDLVLGGFRRWDANHFLHIAEYGYVYEQSLAFYPLYPLCIRVLTNIGLALGLSLVITFRNLALVVAILLNIFFFVKAANVLYSLTIVFRNNVNVARMTVILFCLSPAGIFFTAPYTESLFAWLSFLVMWWCVQKKFLFVVFPLCASILCRSNGLVNIGFVGFYVLYEILFSQKSSKSSRITVLLQGLATITIAGLVFMGNQYFHYTIFCFEYETDYPDYIQLEGIDHRYPMAGQSIRPWCQSDFPIAYSYVQSHYWNVGFLKYYQLKQIPNFILATPIVLCYFKRIIEYVWQQTQACIKVAKRADKFKVLINDSMLVYIVHATFLLIFCLLYVHVQVTTRILAASSPCLYWFSQSAIPKRLNNEYLNNLGTFQNFVIIWFLFYIFVGTILFSNFLPWT